MSLRVGSVVWISVDDPRADVIEAGVIEIESKKGEHCRLRDATGKISFRHVDEVYCSEMTALRARCEQERFWALRYRNAAQECADSEARLRKRIATLEVKPARAAAAR